MILADSKGVIYKGRTIDMTPYKEEFAAETDAAHAGRGACGCGRVRRPLRRRHRQTAT